jgi:hypothetical protein
MMTLHINTTITSVDSSRRLTTSTRLNSALQDLSTSKSSSLLLSGLHDSHLNERHFGRNVIASLLNVDEQDPKVDVLYPKIYDVC